AIGNGCSHTHVERELCPAFGSVAREGVARVETAEAHLHHVAQPPAQRHTATQLAEHEPGALVDVAEVYTPERPSEPAIVRAEQVVDLRCIARCSQIFQAQRVVEIVAHVGIEPERMADTHADHSRAQSMLWSVTLA